MLKFSKQLMEDNNMPTGLPNLAQFKLSTPPATGQTPPGKLNLSAFKLPTQPAGATPTSILPTPTKLPQAAPNSYWNPPAGILPYNKIDSALAPTPLTDNNSAQNNKMGPVKKAFTIAGNQVKSLVKAGVGFASFFRSYKKCQYY